MFRPTASGCCWVARNYLFPSLTFPGFETPASGKSAWWNGRLLIISIGLNSTSTWLSRQSEIQSPFRSFLGQAHNYALDRSHRARRVTCRPPKSDLDRVDTHVIKAREYAELPELTPEMLARATIKKGGRPVSQNPRKLITIRLPADVIARWKSTGPGWQSRMAERLSKAR
jgi:uncharacterized protein (DUF4415 family)